MAQSGGPYRPTRSSTCQSSKNTHDVSLCSKRPGQRRSPAELQNKFTKCTQTWNIKMLQEQREDDDEWVSSEEWLKWRSLESCNLTLPLLLSCSTAAFRSLTDDSACTQLEISPELLADFESQLYQMIEMYHSRIRWLTQGSRKMFGLVTGSRLAVLIDCSDISCLPDLQRHLLLLTEEQLRMKEQLHLISFGTDVSCLWEKPRELTKQRLQEVQDWILQLRSTGCCNLLQALEEAQRHTQLDSMLIILGPCPDHSVDALLSYVAELVQDRELSVHVVSYSTCSPAVTEAVKNIAKVTGGRYHLFSAALGVVDSSSDLEPLWAEIKSARDVLQHIQDMRCGFKDTPVSEISTNLDSLCLSEPDSGLGSRAALCLQPAGPLASTSAEWLKTHGLKAKKLGLYQVLAPNVYSPLESFVPILGESVHSKVHEKAMVQFEWHDGTMKNVHVDLPSLQRYQRRLLEAVCVLEDRVTWLNGTSCRQIWGTLCEQSLQILLDMAHMNVHYHLHLQHAVRLLLQEQLPNTLSFNIIVFGSDVKPFREKMVPSTPENIQAAWQWIQGLECGGQRNTLTALRHAVESHLHTEPSVTRGVYLFTTGMPDQDTSAISSYVAEFYSGPALRLHVCLFSREDKQLEYQAPSFLTRAEVALYLRNLAHTANGRFHYITDTGIVESDDIIVLIGEMQKAAHYWQKCCDLVDSLVQRSSSSDPEEDPNQECHSPKSWTHKYRLPPPRDTRLSLARLEKKEGTRSHTWRPNSAKAVIPPAGPVDGWEPVRKVKSAKTMTTDVSRSVFYLENGDLGSVFKTYIKPKIVQKHIGTVKIPKHESISSTKQWLKLFGIRRLKLDLHRLLSGPECTHRKKLVPSVHKSVSAKYCAIFPSVQLNGTVKHLFLSAGELKQYLMESERVLQRYAQRMQWLLTGSRRVFGCVLERAVCVMLDVSGSMAPCLPTLHREITSLIWDQLHANNIKFSMLAFSGEVQMWQDELVEASEERCRDAVTWLAQLNTHGGSSVLHALQVACVFGDSVSLYLISDGRFDCSCNLMLKEVERLTAGKHVTIHTITFNCLDSSTRSFLKTLAHKTGGRFHQVPSEADTVEANELLIRGFGDGEEPVLPPFEGDDLKRLKAEIEKLAMFQKQAKAFREMLLTRNPPALSK